MSSYRPPYRRNAWPDREAEKREAERLAAEEQRRRMVMNESNFPSIASARPIQRQGGNQYAKLAQQWAVDAEVDRRMEEYKKFQESVDRNEQLRIRSHHAQRTRYERHDDEYEEELAPETTPASQSVLEDSAGWTEVRKKTRKPKRELTVEEMDELDRQRQQAEVANDEFNGHLFESNRHDHDRV